MQFGKNIVQYDKFNWSYIQTEHFDIYFYGSSKNQAEFVAYYAEEACLKISKYIGWGLNKRSEIIVYDSHNDFQQTNVVPIYMEEGIGGVTESMKNRMVIPYDGSLEVFKHVIYHELVHVFINDNLYGGSIMSKIRNQSIQIPLWMNEGLAEYLAGDWDTNSDMWLRDISLNYEQIPTINNLNGYLAYRGGQSVWKFITTKWGDEVIGEIFDNIKYKRDLNKGLEETLGIDIKELTNQWHKYIKKQYWPDLELREDVQDIARQVTNHIDLYNNYNIAPSISPDGSKIAMYSNKNGEMSIYIISSKDGEFLSKIITGQVTSEFEELHILKPGVSWSPDGKNIVFAAKSGSSDILVIVDVDNPKKKIKKRFDLEGIVNPKWNPKNNKIAFIGYTNFSSDIYIYDLDTDTLEQKTNDSFSDMQVSWFSNGEELLFVSDRGNHTTLKEYIDILSIINTDFSNHDIYKLTSDNIIVKYTDTPFNEFYPSISPDGNRITYISDESGINNIYVTDDQFISSKNLTNVLTGITQVSWSANNQVIFTGFYKGGYDIFILSNVSEKLVETDNIINSKWKDNTKPKLLVNNDTSINKRTRSLRNFQFTSNNLDKLTIEDVDDVSYSNYKDSIGTHVAYKYKTHMTLDYAGAQLAYDVIQGQGQGMATFLLSDILGNHKLGIQTSLVIDLKQSDVIFQYINLKNRINWATEFYSFSYPSRMYYDYLKEEEFYDLNRDIHLGFSLQNPFSKFSRIELGVSNNYLERKEERKNLSNGDEYSILKDSYNIIDYHFKYVWDNTRQLSGNRTYIEYLEAPNLTNNDFAYSKISLDSRQYYRVSFKNQTILATRFFLGSSFGKDARIFAIGGSDYNTFFHGDTDLLNPTYRENVMNDTEYNYLTMNNFQYPIRGYNIGQKYGSKAMLLNLELRLPFLIYYFPAIKYIGQLFGVFFVDAGVAWNDIYPEFSNQDSWDLSDNEGWIMSYGFGPRFYFLGMPWKLDYAWQYNPYKGTTSSRHWYLSVGFDF